MELKKGLTLVVWMVENLAVGLVHLKVVAKDDLKAGLMARERVVS